ncbi:hypothetical protein [Stella sp.]|uniref:hypothetical protein n=1 Tax=Stella sp. TaxID=2912054 RepID=UPI0035B32F8B
MNGAAPGGRRLVVSGADAPYFGLLRGLFLSLRRLRLLERAHFGVLDGGLAQDQRAWLARRGAIVVPAEWGFDFRLADHLARQQRSLKILVSRPRLPALFPGYDTILWLDADLWVQTPDAVELHFRVAERGRLAAVMEMDRSYAELRAGRPYWERIRRWTTAVAGTDVADALETRPTINAGTLALSSDAPHWECWRRLVEEGYRRLRAHGFPVFLLDQLALNRVVHLERLPFLPLPTRCNWLCHMALPSWDPASRTLRDPLPPNDPLGIVHVCDHTKHTPMRIPGTDGVWRRMWLTWPPRPGAAEAPADAAAL